MPEIGSTQSPSSLPYGPEGESGNVPAGQPGLEAKVQSKAARAQDNLAVKQKGAGAVLEQRKKEKVLTAQRIAQRDTMTRVSAEDSQRKIRLIGKTSQSSELPELEKPRIAGQESTSNLSLFRGSMAGQFIMARAEISDIYKFARKAAGDASRQMFMGNREKGLEIAENTLKNYKMQALDKTIEATSQMTQAVVSAAQVISTGTDVAAADRLTQEQIDTKAGELRTQLEPLAIAAAGGGGVGPDPAVADAAVAALPADPLELANSPVLAGETPQITRMRNDLRALVDRTETTKLEKVNQLSQQRQAQYQAIGQVVQSATSTTLAGTKLKAGEIDAAGKILETERAAIQDFKRSMDEQASGQGQALKESFDFTDRMIQQMARSSLMGRA